MKTELRVLLSVVFLLLGTVLLADTQDELGCLSGDCVNGNGTQLIDTPDGLLRYRGAFVNSVYHGYGKLEMLDKKVVYKGRFVNGKRHGRGTEWDADNNVYIGQWKYDKRNGEGLQAYHVDGWSEDKHGERWLSKNSENYQGTFLNNNFDGEGTYRWPDGVSYTGGWAANKKHGRGYFLYTTGVRSDRIFNFDERVYDEPLPR